jgi:aminoglycoside phosphotransferase family enzyme/predicted kinase
MTDQRLAAAMSRPDFYPHRPASVELVQTHISFVFIAGDLVYKVKKAVDFGFLDFTTLEKRREYCLKEVALNRRLAPEAYLGVDEISEGEDGELTLGPGRKVVDYAVRMARLPEDRMLVNLLAEKKIEPGQMAAIARKVGDFHAHAETGGDIDRFGSLETIKRNHDENFEQTESFLGRTIERAQYDFLKAYIYNFLRSKKELLDRRVAGRRIRDCHGDLHAEHVCMADSIIIFDCIEFNDRFRYSDTAADVAFLAMDLDFRGYPEYSAEFVKAYLEHSGDADLAGLLPFYQCYYAYVRGKVIGFRLNDPSIPEAEKKAARLTARRYFNLAAKYAAMPGRPLLIITTGLMGSGKSALARNLGAVLDAEVIRTDVLRKEILNIRPEERRLEKFGEGIYSEEMSSLTYEKAFEKAKAVLAGGRSVIIDASFKRNAARIRAAGIAGESGSGFFAFQCECPSATVRERLDRRIKNSLDPSDGRWELYEQQKRDYEEVSGLPVGTHIIVDTGGSQIRSLYQALSGMLFPTG